MKVLFSKNVKNVQEKMRDCGNNLIWRFFNTDHKDEIYFEGCLVNL